MALKERYPRNRKPSRSPWLSSECTILVPFSPDVSLKRGQDFLEKKNTDAALPFLFKAIDDPHHLDVCSSISKMLPQDMAIKFLEFSELKGERGWILMGMSISLSRHEVVRIYRTPWVRIVLRLPTSIAPQTSGGSTERGHTCVLRTLMHAYVNAKHWDKAAYAFLLVSFPGYP